jgi:hypothetical protein
MRFALPARTEEGDMAEPEINACENPGDAEKALEPAQEEASLESHLKVVGGGINNVNSKVGAVGEAGEILGALGKSHIPGVGTLAQVAAPISAISGVSHIMSDPQKGAGAETSHGVADLAAAGGAFMGVPGAVMGLGAHATASGLDDINKDLKTNGTPQAMGLANRDGSATTATDMAANTGTKIRESVTELTGNKTIGNIAGLVGMADSSLIATGAGLLRGVGNFIGRPPSLGVPGPKQ